jgi:hypothetical protein
MIASARVGSPTTSYKRSKGSWLVIKEGALIVAIINNLEEISALLVIERFGSPIVNNQ